MRIRLMPKAQQRATKVKKFQNGATAGRRAKPTKNARAPKLTNALSQAGLNAGLDQLSAVELQGLLHQFCGLSTCLRDPPEQSLRGLRDMHPLLGQIIDFDIIFARLSILERFERGIGRVRISSFFPELETVRERCLERVCQLRRGVAKAEGWLKPIAQEAEATADLEAAIYFASRGQPEIIDPSVLTASWHAAVCRIIEYGAPYEKVSDDVRARAQARTMSLAEAARIRPFGKLQRFFYFRDEEEDFIDATMFRAVDWLGITGFEPWLDSIIEEMSVGPQNGLKHAPGCWWLFHWCRSDLLLSMIDRPGLEAWLWALINGPDERYKPWRIFSPERGNPRMGDYIPIMGILPFVWHRIRPSNIGDDVVKVAVSLLLQTQLNSGAWPLEIGSSEACLLTTCVAIHGLYFAKPRGWERLTSRAASWLRTQQQPEGCWDYDGAPTVMLTVLVLDALALVGDGHHVTFRKEKAIELAAKKEAGKKGKRGAPRRNKPRNAWIVRQRKKGKTLESILKELHDLGPKREWETVSSCQAIHAICTKAMSDRAISRRSHFKSNPPGI